MSIENKEVLQDEKREWSPGIDDVRSKIIEGIQRKMSKPKENWPTSRGKNWDICWHFQSNSGCRKGVNCKWKHVASVKQPDPFAAQVSFGADRSGYCDGGIAYNGKMGAPFMTQNGLAVSVGLTTQPANVCLDVVTQTFKPNTTLGTIAQTFKPNIWAKEFMPGGINQSVPSPPDSLEVQSNHSLKSMKGDVSNNSLTTEAEVAKGADKYVFNNKNTYSQQVMPVYRKESVPTLSNTDRTIFRALAQTETTKKVINNKMKNSSRISGGRILSIAASGNVIKETFKRNNKVDREIQRPNSISSVKSPRRTPSRKNLPHWADVYSPMMTPHFQNLPMPPLDSMSPILSSRRNGFSPQRRPRDPPPISAEILKRSSSFTRLRQKLGMEGLGEARIKRIPSFPKLDSTRPFPRSSENSQTYDVSHRKSFLKDETYSKLKSEYLSILQSANLKRSSSVEGLKAIGSVLECASFREDPTPKISSRPCSISDPIRESECLRNIGPLQASIPLKRQESIPSTPVKMDVKSILQSAEDLGKESHDMVLSMRSPKRGDAYSHRLAPPKIKQFTPMNGHHHHRGYHSKRKPNLRGSSTRGSGRMGGRVRGRGRGIKIDNGSEGSSQRQSRFPKRGEYLRVKRGARGRRFFRGGRPRISRAEHSSIDRLLHNGNSLGN